MTTITTLLGHWRQGDSEALSKLMTMLNDPLRELAKARLGKERANHTLQPTALINELYLKLDQGVGIDWANRSHFFAVSASIMRRILVDHARKHHRSVQADQRLSLTLAEQLLPQLPNIDLLDLDRALDRLNKIDDMQHQIVELRLFAGLSTSEIASVLSVTQRTIQRKWQVARIWLHAQLKGLV